MRDDGSALAPPMPGDGGGPSVLAKIGRFVFAFVRRFPIWTAIGVLALGGFIFRDFTSGNVGDLKVGDCFDLPKTSTSVKDVQHHPCTDSHDAEMIYAGSVSATSYPADTLFKDHVIANCPPAYKTYVGQDFFSQKTYDINWFIPTSASWAKGDRAVTCFVVRLDNTPITTGSLRAK